MRLTISLITIIVSLRMPLPSALVPFQLLEINIISAQDLAPVTRKMRTYALAWVNPNRKLSTAVDRSGHINPSWNDKFVFRVEEEFLRRDTAAVMVEIYALHWFRNVHVGTVRVLVGNLFPPSPKPQHGQNVAHQGMRFVALQVRRPSGRPQGILNVGVTILDGSMKSMPLYTHSAIGYRQLMGEGSDNLSQIHNGENSKNNGDNLIIPKPILRRSMSDRSELERKTVLETESSIVNDEYKEKEKGLCSASSSMINGSQVVKKGENRTRTKACSMVNGSGIDESMIRKEKRRKATSLLNGWVMALGTDQKGMESSSTINEDDSRKNGNVKNKDERVESELDPLTSKLTQQTSTTTNASEVVDPPKGKLINGLDLANPTKFANPLTRFQGIELRGVHQMKPTFANGSLLSESDVGPSPSEVAAAVAQGFHRQFNDESSSIMDGWSLEESEEGLRSKLERWRTEPPPLYDNNSYRSCHLRRHTDGDGAGGLFSCFGNIYGYECSCVCGKPIQPSSKRGNASGRTTLSPSNCSLDRSYR